MEKSVPRSKYPWWVKVGISCVPGRAGLWVYVALSVAAAFCSVVYGFWDQRFFYFGVAFLLAALMYWLSIRWIDRHGTWGDDS